MPGGIVCAPRSELVNITGSSDRTEATTVATYRFHLFQFLGWGGIGIELERRDSGRFTLLNHLLLDSLRRELGLRWLLALHGTLLLQHGFVQSSLQQQRVLVSLKLAGIDRRRIETQKEFS